MLWIIIQSFSETLQKVGKHPKFLGAETGAVSVLHTWGQALTYHPHIHMLVPAGELSADGTEWIEAGKKFFLLVKVLSAVFRGVLWRLLEAQVKSGSIQWADNVNDTKSLKAALYAKNWNV